MFAKVVCNVSGSRNILLEYMQRYQVRDIYWLVVYVMTFLLIDSVNTYINTITSSQWNGLN